MNTLTSEYHDTDADGQHSQSRCHACTSPQREEIDRRLAAGEKIRDVAAAFSLSVGGIHRHMRSHIPAPQQPPTRHPMPPKRFEGCAICQADADRFAAVNRALSAGLPDVARVANRFDFQESAVLAHWRHAAETMPPAPAAPTHVAVEVAPLVPMTAAEAGILLQQRPHEFQNARARAIAAYNAARAAAGGEAAPLADGLMNSIRARLRGISVPAAYLALRTAEHEFQVMATEDPRTLSGAAAQLRQARIAANAPPTVAFDAGAFLRSLADRGVVLHPLEGERIAVRGALLVQDRARIAEHRAEIARFLTVVETI